MLPLRKSVEFLRKDVVNNVFGYWVWFGAESDVFAFRGVSEVGQLDFNLLCALNKSVIFFEYFFGLFIGIQNNLFIDRIDFEVWIIRIEEQLI
jgi:hypothetical protein